MKRLKYESLIERLEKKKVNRILKKEYNEMFQRYDQS